MAEIAIRKLEGDEKLQVMYGLQVFSNLYPFRESFYERLGYVTFPLPRIAKLAPAALLPLLDQDLGGQVKTESQVRAPMGRVLDVGRLGGMQVGPGRFSARIADPLCPWNEGIWQFEPADGTLRVSRAEQADCDLSIQALTALVYGTHDPGDFAVRGWGNPSPHVQAVMRAMFPPRTPYLHENF